MRKTLIALTVLLCLGISGAGMAATYVVEPVLVSQPV